MEWSTRVIRNGLLVAAFSALVAAAAGAADPGVEGDRAQLAEQGEAIFQARCSPCHGLGSGDRATGPDLAGVLGRRERSWVARFISEPDQVLAEGDPVAVAMLEEYHGLAMPDLGMTEKEIEALLAYLEFPAETEHHAAASPPPAPAAGGDAGRGRELFVGTADFANGGAPCLGCHGIAGAGLGRAAGASYGPDLTGMYEDYGAEGVASILESLPFPSMEPVYAERPLTAAEQADLTAFLAEVAGAVPPRIGTGLAGHVLLGAALFLAVIGGLGWRRLRGGRRPLVEAARRKGGRLA